MYSLSKEYLEKKDQTFKKIIAQRSNKKLQSPSPKKADKFYLFSHFENNAPGAVYLTELGKRDNTHFRPLKTTNVDFSSVNGTMTNCASAKTPWNSHLGSEEDYNFDAYL